MNNINETLRNVSSDVARLELEASDIQEILHGINWNSTNFFSGGHRSGEDFPGMLNNNNGESFMNPSRCPDSFFGPVNSATTQKQQEMINQNLASASALDSLTSQRRELVENLENELQSIGGKSTVGMSLASSLGSTVTCQDNYSQDEMSRNGHPGEGEKLQRQLGVLEELDRQIGTLKSQLKNRSSSSSKSYSSSSTGTPMMNSALMGFCNEAMKRSDHDPNSLSQGFDLRDPASSIISFSSSMEGSGLRSRDFDQIGHKVEMVYSLLSMLSSNDRLESSGTLLLMSKASDTSELMRQSGCVSHLIQLLHPGDIWSDPPTKQDIDVLTQATEALHNLVHNQPDERRKRRESRILKLLDQVRAYTLSLRLVLFGVVPLTEAVSGAELCPTVVTLMRLSFDEEHRKATSKLGGLHALAEMLISDQLNYQSRFPESSQAIRRYAGMALTNLTFGDVHSKHTLCNFPRFLETVNAQILSSVEELTQVYSSVVRNLSWKADSNSKKALREGECVGCLMQSAIKVTQESSLKSILSALWNLSAHCSENKAEICRIPNALEFLVATLSYNKNSPSTTAVIENAGGILRNVSSHIAVSEEYRKILREKNCFQLLLKHLRSSSLTIVSNACGSLWNLSARCATDQKILWELGAVPMLRSLIHSKHKNISLGSAAALKNLLSNQPPDLNANNGKLGSLMQQRKLKALESELDQQLAEVCEKPRTGCMQESGHSQSSGAFMEGTGMAEPPSPLDSHSYDRRYSPGAQVVHMMDKLVQPVSFNGTSRLHHANSVPPRSPENSGSAGPMPQSQSSQSLQRSDISQSSTKEEKMQQDKAAVHRYHNSLRKARRKLNQDLNRAEGDSPDQPRNYANVFPEDANKSKPGPNFDANAEQEDTVKSFCFEGTPQLSKSNSKTDVSNVGGKTQSNNYGASGSPDKTKKFAVEGTPAEFSKSSSLSSLNIEKEEAPNKPRNAPVSSGASRNISNITSPTFSRQSSVESLESCDQGSVRSHIASVYSTQVPTGIVSPSELPDSPGLSCPSSPSTGRAAKLVHRDRESELSREQNRDPSPSIPESRDSLRMGFAGPEREDAMSVASSLSALTIDSETKIRTTKQPKPPLEHFQPPPQEEEPEYATFDRGRESEILEQSIKSAVPVRRSFGTVNSNSMDFAFKVPLLPPPRHSMSAASSQNCMKEGPEDTVKTFQYEGEQKEVRRQSVEDRNLPSGVSSASGPSSRAEPVNSDSIRAVIKSAMPKPRPKQTGKQGKAIAIAKPMVRKSSNAETSSEKTVVTAKNSRNGCPSPNTGSSKLSKALDSAHNSSLADCINLAMPKPKQIDRAKLTPQKAGDSSQKKGRSDHKAKSEKSPQKSSPKKTPDKTPVCPDHNGDFLEQRPSAEEKGILEASGISQLVGSSATNDSFLMKQSNATDLEDIAPPEGLMDISVSSCSLMRNSATSEKVKDASNLLLKDSLLRQAVAGSPKKQNSETQCDRNCVEMETVCAAVIKTGSDGSESLSEDNYSRIDEDENFDISPEDIDLNLVEEDANKLILELEHGPEAVELQKLISDRELLIDCETISLVSSESHMTYDCDSEIAGFEETKGPRIRLPSEQGSVADENSKVIRGGRGKGARQSPAPKMAVRTTKTAQLRAKRASESSNEGGRTSAASGARTPVKCSASPRPDVSRSGSNASDCHSSKLKQSKVKAISNSVKSKQPPPPVPPKPKLLQPKVRPPPVGNSREKLGDSRNPSPTSARISPYNYNKGAAQKKTDIIAMNNHVQITESQSDNNPEAVKTSQAAKGSSKRMLVTTV